MLNRVATPEPAAKLLAEAAERMKLSARGYHRVLKVARTIADLAKVDQIAKPHIAEALSAETACRCRSLRSTVAVRCARISSPSN